MKSIFPVVLVGFFLIIPLDVTEALNKDGLSLSQANHSEPEKIETKKEPDLYNSSRGQMLYENHCLACHESQMHVRANTKVRNMSQLSYFVLIRSSELKLKWGEEERNAVIKYLNERYYKLP